MSHKYRRRPFVVLSLITALVAGLLATVPAAIAALGDRPLITYNMQGANSGQDSKWTTTIAGYAARAEVLLLQEVGAEPPPNARGSQPEILTGQQLANAGQGLPQNGNAHRVVHSQWQSSRFVTNDVYFLQTDAAGGTFEGGRVNLAIVTQRAADEVAALPNPMFTTTNGAARATLGVRLGDTWYFDIHALSSNGGVDAPGLIGSIRDFVTGRARNENWVVMGDFNREPGSLQGRLPAGAQLFYTGQPTQQSGRELDYAVYSGSQAGVQVNRLGGASADHYAVAVGALRASAEPTPMYFSDRAVESMQAGGLLDAADGGTSNLTPIISSRRNGGDNQSWAVDSYDDGSIRLKGKGSGRCMSLAAGVVRPGASGAGAQVWLYDCTNDSDQRWTPEYLGNEQYQLHSRLHPELCMNIKGGQTNPSDVKQVIIWGCANTPNERWLFTPAAATKDLSRFPVDLSHALPGPSTVESLRSGGVIDVTKNKTANGSGVASSRRNGGPNQGWDLLWQDSQTLSFRGVSSKRCLDIHGTAAPRRDLVIFDCNDQPSQQWRPEQLDNGQVVIHSVPHPELCMDISGGPVNPDEGTLTVDNCTAAANQQWLFTSFDPTGTPPPDTDTPRRHDELTVLPDPGKPAERVAYYPSWSVYANALYAKNLDTEGTASKLTTLTYAFENIDPANLTCFANNKPGSSDESNTSGNDGGSDAWADYQMGYTTENSIDGVADTWNQPLKGNFNQLKKLKARHPNLKVLVSLGGWTYSKYFSDAAATDASRKKFVSSCIDLYVKGNLPVLGDNPAGGQGVGAGVFDGFDIDWEFPASANGHTGNHFGPQDTANYAALLAEFRGQLDALGGKHYRLTAAVPSGPADIDRLPATDVAQSLDMANVMTYDMHGAWETSGPTNSQAPLFESPLSPGAGTGLTVNDAINHYLMNGFPADKLAMGVPFYARGWTGVPDGGNHGLYQSVTGPSAPFPLSKQPGVAMYKELAAAGKLANIYYDFSSFSSWAYDGSTFYSVETPMTLTGKRQYIKDKHLGGIMMYSLEADQGSTLLNAATGFTS